MKKAFCLVFAHFIIFFTSAAIAGIRLPSVIGSHMVLQQQSAATLWGWADPGETIMVTASWNGLIDSVVAPSDGRWKIKIPTPVAGGPYTITLKGWSTVVLENILIGEVWICSGQSNMEWSSYNNNQQIIDELPKSANSQIRLFHIPRTTSAFPQDNCEGNWEVCGPETVKGFSAIGYFFGKKLQQQLGVPVGLIEAAWGGTPVETWTPADIIAGDSVMKMAASQLPATPWGPHLPGIIYNGMIAPVVNYGIAGAIWYQGESNTGIAQAYQTTFSAMIGAWRKAFGKNFPFYYVQIAPFNYDNKQEGALLMEQQARTLSCPNTGMVVITDLVDDINDIHPRNKYDVADRLANLALAETYHRNIPAYKSPVFKSMAISGGQATLFFENAPNGFMTKGNARASEFYIAGKDRLFLPADVKIKKDRIIVSNKQVPDPVAVRFGFSNTAMANLFSREGLPVTPFRTDKWDTVMPE